MIGLILKNEILDEVLVEALFQCELEVSYPPGREVSVSCCSATSIFSK